MTSSNSFASLGLLEPILRGVVAAGYDTMTPIQAQAIPPLLAGRDVLGCAQTGTGKTAAFLLPILHRLASTPQSGRPQMRALVLTPTRELASQIAENCETYGQFLGLRHVVIFGGVSQRNQVAALRRGVDIVIATPGRLLDLHGQGYIDFDAVDFFVLDEADRMLDMGFVRDIRKVLDLLPQQRQNLLFSATMPGTIVKLASAFLHNPVRVEVNPQSTTVERIEQSVMFVSSGEKKLLLAALLDRPEFESAIVFTRTKHGANRVVKELDKTGIASAAIHGNKAQGARERALADFKAGTIGVLVATDIASRGIDIDGVSHVINYDLPNIPESYVHRIGRTARAGRDGVAIAFCDETETVYLRDIEKLIGRKLDVVTDHPWHFARAMPGPAQLRPNSQRAAGPAPQQTAQRSGGERPQGPRLGGERAGGAPTGASRRRRRGGRGGRGGGGQGGPGGGSHGGSHGGGGR